jgi:hypothetical protein
LKKSLVESRAETTWQASGINPARLHELGAGVPRLQLSCGAWVYSLPA